MIIKTIDTNETFEINDDILEYNKPYVFSENNKDWFYAKSWNYFPGIRTNNMLEMLNPNMIRKNITYKLSQIS